MPLDPGMKFAPLAMKPADAQLLETRSFNIEELCRWFGTPPILIGHAPKGQTMFGSGVEQRLPSLIRVTLSRRRIAKARRLGRRADLIIESETRRWGVDGWSWCWRVPNTP